VVSYHGGSSGQSPRKFYGTPFITSWDTLDLAVRPDIYRLCTFTILERNASIDHTQRRRVGEVAATTVNNSENYNVATQYT
jgi:hypothetical protein